MYYVRDRGVGVLVSGVLSQIISNQASSQSPFDSIVISSLFVQF